ncbi:restriction endonuclease subunit S [Pseudoalteromonas tetraodonis]|uniref:restriction endonuclease subunit S n=1 Tax=Pseudoalteromonas tetraodonis TaxID=43659 RepID=UPI003735CDFD
MAGRYKAYSEYVSTGKDYYGDIPSHWHLEKIKYNSYVKGRQGWQNLRADEYQDVGPYLVTGSHFDTKGGVDWNACYRVSEERYERDRDIWIQPGDVLMTKDGTIGKIAFVDSLPYKACLNSHLLIIRDLNCKYDQRFLYHLLTSTAFKGFIPTRQSGTTFMGITQESVEEFPLVICPLEEQQKIANFLDHETAKIDTLIAKQEKLIELLKEKRQAVISHAVTKGLNPNAPMRDSGVDWLGEVPEHWVVGRVKNLAKLISKGTTPSTIGGDFVDSGIRFLKGENIGKSIFVNPSPAFHISEEVDAQLSRSRLQENDVLVIIAGATTGKASILTKELLPANTNQAVSFIRPKKASYSKLIAFWLSTDFAQRVIWMGAVQAAQPNLSMEDLGNLPIVLPTEDEIAPLLFEIDKKLEQFDLLVKKANGAIKLMQERKTALISAAVTGKIDVRHFVAEQGQPQEFKVE